MKKTAPETTSDIYPIAGLICGIILVAMVGGAGLLSLRHQIAQSAQNAQSVQAEIVEIQRRVNYLDNKIAEVNNPSYLHRRTVELGLRLQPAQHGQVVRIASRRPDSAEVAAGVRRRESGEPFVQTFDLAVMEPLRRLD